jgi:acetylornithine deacetylase/succinyl-diaminopimelate desuccinylase family protein
MSSSHLRDAISGTISAFTEEIVDFASSLIAVPTENPPGREYGACARVITDRLRSIGFNPEVLAIPGTEAAAGVPGTQCVRAFYGAGKRTLCFHGHYDVVPAQSDTQFRPRREGDHLYGRGAADMKGGLAAMTFAVKALRDLSLPLDGRIGLLFVPDEEAGGAQGTAALMRAGLLEENVVGMLTPEPSSGVIWNASRGAISLKITIKGKPAHVGLQFQGSNSFEHMVALANRLLKLKQEVESRKTTFNIVPDEASRSILLLGGTCAGGTNFNMVPAEMYFTVDRRINPEESLEHEEHRLLNCLGELTASGIETAVEIIQRGRPTACSESEFLAHALARNIELVVGQAATFEMCPGLLETRFYAERGIPALAYGPGLLSVSHGPEERVSIQKLCQCATIYALTAAEILMS